MITNCAGGFSVDDFQEATFFTAILDLVILFSPGAIGYTVWRIILSNRASFRVRTVLRLDENTETCSDPGGRGISWTVVLYSLAAGVFVFEALPYIQSLIHD